MVVVNIEHFWNVFVEISNQGFCSACTLFILFERYRKLKIVIYILYLSKNFSFSHPLPIDPNHRYHDPMKHTTEYTKIETDRWSLGLPRGVNSVPLRALSVG